MPNTSVRHLPYARWTHTLLRIVSGAIIAQHGAQKLFGVLGGFGGGAGAAAPIGSTMWLVGILELGGGVLVLIGLITRVAAFLLSGEMAFAYFTVHLPNGFWPIQNKGELAVVLCFVFLYFAATGAGAASIDALLQQRRPKPVMP